MTIVELLVAYIIVVWIGFRLIIPHLGFSKEPVPQTISPGLAQKIEDLNKSSQTNYEFLERAYAYITSTYSGGRIKTITHFLRGFGDMCTKDPGFLPCTGQNFLLRTMLVKSGRFSEDDIRVITVPLNLFIHQYLKVKVDGKEIDVDPWSHFLGVPLGKHSAFFG